MAVCPGHTVEPLPATSENLQNKEVCSLYLFLWEALVYASLINLADSYRALSGIYERSKFLDPLDPQYVYSLVYGTLM